MLCNPNIKSGMHSFRPHDYGGPSFPLGFPMLLVCGGHLLTEYFSIQPFVVDFTSTLFIKLKIVAISNFSISSMRFSRFPLESLFALTVITQCLCQDYTCSSTKPCALGCCGHNNVCGLGPSYCAPENCTSSCDQRSECDPGWGAQWSAREKCPLNVCCSKFGRVIPFLGLSTGGLINERLLRDHLRLLWHEASQEAVMLRDLVRPEDHRIL